VLGHLADGGFSSVYAVRPADDRTAERHGTEDRALKCLWGTPAELTAIRSEADTMSAVSGHGNVVGLITHFRFGLPDAEAAAQHPGDHFLGMVQELAAEDLYGLARRCGPDERSWAAVFEQIAAGLAHVHARRVVHGDIKPTNLLRIGGRFAVADFGVSAPLDTTRSAGIGLARTLPFWPPESGAQGSRTPDGVRLPPAGGWRASQPGDVWALAVSMHRVLTGRHITAGSTPEEQYELVCAGRYGIDDGLGAGWRALLVDCLAREPSQRRVTTAADLRRRLAELVAPPGTGFPEDPLPVAFLDAAPGEGAVVLTLDRPGGRVCGVEVPTDSALLPVVRYAYAVLLPKMSAELAAHRLTEQETRAAERALFEQPTARFDQAALADRSEREDHLVAELGAVAGDLDVIGRERDWLAKEVARLGVEHRQLVSALAGEEDRSQRLGTTLERVRAERGRAIEESQRQRKEHQRSERERLRLARQVAELQRARPVSVPTAWPYVPRPQAPPQVQVAAPRRRRVGCLIWLLLLLVAVLALALAVRHPNVVNLPGRLTSARQIVHVTVGGAGPPMSTVGGAGPPTATAVPAVPR
jgi:hypothetical protein